MYLLPSGKGIEMIWHRERTSSNYDLVMEKTEMSTLQNVVEYGGMGNRSGYYITANLANLLQNVKFRYPKTLYLKR